MHPYRPEGVSAVMPTVDALRKAVGTGEIFQAQCVKCDEFHNLHLNLGETHGIIPREEAAIGIREGTTKEIAILSRVGKWVSFQVLAFDNRGNAILSRRSAQLDARNYILSTLRPGDVIPAVVQNPTEFGVFCDIGCGFTALMRIDRCCVSRLTHTDYHFQPGQLIYVAILDTDEVSGLVQLTERELLGTWEENAAQFRPGQTVMGTVRSVMPYGVFIELTPNLSGLAENSVEAAVGDTVSVYIRSIQPERHKIKLNVIERLSQSVPPVRHYFITSGHIDHWVYHEHSSAVTHF